jgi:hypothetical protein
MTKFLTELDEDLFDDRRIPITMSLMENHAFYNGCRRLFRNNFSSFLGAWSTDKLLLPAAASFRIPGVTPPLSPI